jgi:ribosomal protein L29
MKKRMEKFKGMRAGELIKKLADLREEMRVLRFKSEGAKSKNVKESATLKKEIARALTLIKQGK